MKIYLFIKYSKNAVSQSFMNGKPLFFGVIVFFFQTYSLFVSFLPPNAAQVSLTHSQTLKTDFPPSTVV